MCLYDYNKHDFIPVLYLAESSLIPFTLLVLTALLLVRALFKSRHIHSDRMSRVRHLAANAIALSALFALLVGPLVLYFLIPAAKHWLKSSEATKAFLLLWYLNYALHSYAHLCVNGAYRSELMAVLDLRKEAT